MGGICRCGGRTLEVWKRDLENLSLFVYPVFLGLKTLQWLIYVGWVEMLGDLGGVGVVNFLSERII